MRKCSLSQRESHNLKLHTKKTSEYLCSSSPCTETHLSMYIEGVTCPLGNRSLSWSSHAYIHAYTHTHSHTPTQRANNHWEGCSAGTSRNSCHPPANNESATTVNAPVVLLAQEIWSHVYKKSFVAGWMDWEIIPVVRNTQHDANWVCLTARRSHWMLRCQVGKCRVPEHSWEQVKDSEQACRRSAGLGVAETEHLFQVPLAISGSEGAAMLPSVLFGERIDTSTRGKTFHVLCSGQWHSSMISEERRGLRYIDTLLLWRQFHSSLLLFSR